MAGSKPLVELEPSEPDHSRLEFLNRGRRAVLAWFRKEPCKFHPSHRAQPNPDSRSPHLRPLSQTAVNAASHAP